MTARLALLFLLLVSAPAAAEPAGWDAGTPAPLPRQEAALAALDGRLYFAGGFEHGGAETSRHEVYDIATATWSLATPLPEPAHHLVGVGLGGRIYYLGGLQTLAFNPTGRMWAYDPGSGLWSQRAGLPLGRQRGAGAVAVHDGRIVYVGGQRIVFENGFPRRIPVAEVDVYDPATDTWTRMPDMPTPRDHFGVGVVGDTLYAVGGRALRFDQPVAATEALDLRTGAWTIGLAPIPTKRGGFATGVVGGRIVAIGGESPHAAGATPLHVHAHEQAEAYDPDEDAWRTLPPMPLPRYGIQGAVEDRGIWVAGGGTGMSVDATAALHVLYPAGRPPARPAPAG